MFFKNLSASLDDLILFLERLLLFDLPLTPIWRLILSNYSDFFSLGLDLVLEVADFDFDLSTNLPLTILEDGLLNFLLLIDLEFKFWLGFLKSEVMKSDFEIYLSNAFEDDCALTSNGFLF